MYCIAEAACIDVSSPRLLSVISEKELGHAGNAGLSKAVALLRDIKSNHSTISWADLIQMAGALAVELTGGGKIDMKYGRLDALTTSTKVGITN